MYERFTDRGRRVMQLANQEAQRFDHEYIGTEHILLGLIAEGAGVAANVLNDLGVDLRKAHREVEKIVQYGPGGDQVVAGPLPHTPRTKKVIEYAIEEAKNLYHLYVGTEHLLLGLLREHEGVAAQILMNLGVKLDDVRQEVLNLLGHGSSGRAGPQSEEAKPYVVPGRIPVTEVQLQLLDARVERLKAEKEQFVIAGDFASAANCREEADALTRLVAWYRWLRDRP